jgi:hypothetical protein
VKRKGSALMKRYRRWRHRHNGSAGASPATVPNSSAARNYP